MTEENEKVPYFIQMRGCINCNTSKEYKKRHGGDYGFDHALIVCCLISGCHDEGFSLMNPFFDPEEVIRLTKKQNLNEQESEKVKDYLEKIKKRFGNHYEKIGVSLDKLIEEI